MRDDPNGEPPDPPVPPDAPEPLESEPAFQGMPYGALRRYALGTSDATERERVEAWAALATPRRAYLAALGRTFAASQSDASDSERAATDAASTALSAKLTMPPPSAATDVSPPFVAPWEAPAIAIDVRRRRAARVLSGAFESERRSFVRAAAAAVIVALTTGALLQVTTGRARHSVTAAPPVVMREVATAAGQRARLDLGDGSTVTLGVKSRLHFASDFGARTRELYLDGEAYFVVQHDSTRPFIVHAAGSKTIDVGTVFVLRAYSTDPQVQVVVADGSVALGADQPGAPSPTVLERGQMGRLSRGASAPTVRSVDPSGYAGWLENRLRFDNVPLGDVIADIGRWHDVEIRLADPSLAKETFTASFSTESLSTVLEAVTTTLDLRAIRHGNTVTLYRRSRRLRP